MTLSEDVVRNKNLSGDAIAIIITVRTLLRKASKCLAFATEIGVHAPNLIGEIWYLCVGQ